MSVHYLTQVAMREGWITRKGACEQCGHEQRLGAHHEDYSKPLEVKWLCTKCHSAWHKENGPGKHRERARMNEPKEPEPRPKDKALAERYDEMLALKEGGLNYAQIGLRFNLSRERVRQILGNRDVPQEMKLKVEASKKRIVSMRLTGNSIEKIAHDTGIPKGQLRKIEDLPDRVVPLVHGVYKGYQRGCKCKACLAACAKRHRDRLHGLRNRGLCVACRIPSKTWVCDACNQKRIARKAREK